MKKLIILLLIIALSISGCTESTPHISTEPKFTESIIITNPDTTITIDGVNYTLEEVLSDDFVNEPEKNILNECMGQTAYIGWKNV